MKRGKGGRHQDVCLWYSLAITLLTLEFLGEREALTSSEEWMVEWIGGAGGGAGKGEGGRTGASM